MAQNFAAYSAFSQNLEQDCFTIKTLGEPVRGEVRQRQAKFPVGTKYVAVTVCFAQWLWQGLSPKAKRPIARAKPT